MREISGIKITESHIKLINRMRIGWEVVNGVGAPIVEGKRPYGNSDIAYDVLEIIGIPYDGGNEALEEFALRLHRETEEVLQRLVRIVRLEDFNREEEKK